ncbi:hypothetical protein LCGC14_2024650 [marine sediment metagenome]|uniref:Uncharacterized protein n=1 Tax=marine sediment metagenome TaxID=412755 RepID=A0A0F9EWP3_9ZZZZ|nr:hypothetical protein [bacterium]
MKYKEALKIVEQHREDERIKKDKKLDDFIKNSVGKTFVYRNNSYGSGSVEWDVFYTIIRQLKDKSALVESWELIDPKNKIFNIERKSVYIYDWNVDRTGFNGNPWCTRKEFDKNKKRILLLLENTLNGCYKERKETL